MRRADRLFQIIQILRRTHFPVTAAKLAEELEVSKRTVYRDMADLAGQRIPVAVEAGTGYVLSSDYDMPPLMFTAEELEAVFLGIELVKQLPDATLAHNANDVLAKITSVIPKKLMHLLTESTVAIKPDNREISKSDTREIRAAIRNERKIFIKYRAADGNISERVIWPIVLGYDFSHSLLIAWCENKKDFRHFRISQIVKIIVMNDSIRTDRKSLKLQWQRWRSTQTSQPDIL